MSHDFSQTIIIALQLQILLQPARMSLVLKDQKVSIFFKSFLPRGLEEQLQGQIPSTETRQNFQKFDSSTDSALTPSSTPVDTRTCAKSDSMITDPSMM